MEKRGWTAEDEAEYQEIYGLRGSVCAGVLDKWVREGVKLPLSWNDIVYASWALWPDQRSLMSVLLAECEQDLEFLYGCIEEDLERGEDVLATEGYSPALWLLVLEGRRLLEEMGIDEGFIG